MITQGIVLKILCSILNHNDWEFLCWLQAYYLNSKLKNLDLL